MGVRKSFPILTTTDLERLESFYVAALGAQRTYEFSDDFHEVFVALRLGDSELGLALDERLAHRPCAVALWVDVDDVDEVYGRCLDEGAVSVAEPALMPWGERVAQVRDPAGFTVHLGDEAG